MKLQVVLISTYELGRQPFGLASPAAWLREAGAGVRCFDLAVEPLDGEAVRAAHLVAFYIPMHMATRMAVSALEKVRQLNPTAHICFFGLYGPENAAYLRRLGVDTVLGGEFETGLVSLARRLAGGLEITNHNGRQPGPSQMEPLVSLERQTFLVPDRSGLPGLAGYAHLVAGDNQHRVVGYVEASRGCKHLCRHCPIVPVYGGRFRVVQPEVVLADVEQQVAAGAQHITFGDPDFFNGIGHALPLVTALHRAHPHLTYDVTIKVEHLLKHADRLQTLKDTGCLFVTTAVESFDDRILKIFQKQHTRADFERALAHSRRIGLLLSPTFVAFTPWTSLAGYQFYLSEIVRLDLVEQVAPIQHTIRLLIPPGSRLLGLPEVEPAIDRLEESMFSYVWRNPDPRVDALQKDLERLVQQGSAQGASRREIFEQIWQRAHRAEGGGEIVLPDLAGQAWAGAVTPVPYMTESWYC